MANNTSKAETQDKTAKNVAEYHRQLKPGTPEFDMKKDFIKDEITGKVKRYFGKTIAKAGRHGSLPCCSAHYTRRDNGKVGKLSEK